MTRYFDYGTTETDHLSAHDPQMGTAIATIGHIQREVDPDIFSSIVHQIVGQQITTKAQATIWSRFTGALGAISAPAVLGQDVDALQALGISHRKASYILDLAQRVEDGRIDLDALWDKDDAEVVGELIDLRGVGTWTAEMVLLFCMQRPDVLSSDDLGIQRGLRMLHHHRGITPALFEHYRRRYSPYGSVASLYLWAVAGGAVPGLRDPAQT